MFCSIQQRIFSWSVSSRNPKPLKTTLSEETVSSGEEHLLERTKTSEVYEMAQKVAKAGVKKEKGYLYFVDKQGDISRAKMARGR